MAKQSKDWPIDSEKSHKTIFMGGRRVGGTHDWILLQKSILPWKMRMSIDVHLCVMNILYEGVTAAGKPRKTRLKFCFIYSKCLNCLYRGNR